VDLCPTRWAIVVGFWRILEDIGGYWRILEDIGGYWRILEDIGGYFRGKILVFE